VAVSQRGQEEGGVVLMARRSRPAGRAVGRGALIVDLEAALNRLIGADSEITTSVGNATGWPRSCGICVPGAMCKCRVGGCCANTGPQGRRCFGCAATSCTRPTTPFSADPNDKG
jgi:hypothetical protein